MILEYIPRRQEDRYSRPKIRLYDFTSDEVKQLRRTFASLASGLVSVIELHELPWIVAIDGCRLTLRLDEKNERGIIAVGGQLECIYTEDGWLDLAAKTEPMFDLEPHSSQELTMEGDVDFILDVTK